MSPVYFVTSVPGSDRLIRHSPDRKGYLSKFFGIPITDELLKKIDAEQPDLSELESLLESLTQMLKSTWGKFRDETHLFHLLFQGILLPLVESRA